MTEHFDTPYRYFIKQVPPDAQRSHLLEDYAGRLNETLFVYGNRNYREYVSDYFKNLVTVCLDGGLIEKWLYDEKFEDENKIETLRNKIKMPDGSDIHLEDATKFALEFEERVAEWFDGKLPKKINDLVKYIGICEIMSFVSKHTWTYTGIYGKNYLNDPSQKTIIFYDTRDWNEDDTVQFESEYFNTGTEWIIHDRDFVPETAGDIDGYYLYTRETEINEIKDDIARRLNCMPEEIQAYVFKQYIHFPIYRIT